MTEQEDNKEQLCSFTTLIDSEIAYNTEYKRAYPFFIIQDIFNDLNDPKLIIMSIQISDDFFILHPDIGEPCLEVSEINDPKLLKILNTLFTPYWRRIDRYDEESKRYYVHIRKYTPEEVGPLQIPKLVQKS